jgi:uracil-DNA glycosylase
MPSATVKPANYPPPPIPAGPTATGLRSAIQECRACDLWTGATQAVMGEGATHASLMLVGEQPGDKEDPQGHPFVGPAGGVLDQGMREAAINTDDVYITNVVKHFRYKARGKHRIHQKPDRWQVYVCLPGLAELVTLTAHPSSILRARTDEARDEAMRRFVNDLRTALGLPGW